MTRRLLLTYLTITAFTLIVVVVPLGLTFSSRERTQLEFDVERDAQSVASLVEDDLENGTKPELAAVFERYHVDGARILVVDAQGRSVADSDRSDLDRDYSTRPEIAAALDGRRSTGSRWSDTLDTNLVFVAIPVASDGAIHGAVRITLPSATVDQRVRDTWIRLGALSAVVLVTVGSVGLVLARSVTRPIRRVEEAARLLADGDLDARAGEVDGPPEIAALARQFDATAERLAHLVEVQRRFVSDASHQLRTPLTALRLRLETMRPSAEDQPRVEAALAETDRLGRLVQSLLSIARTDASPTVLDDIDLAAIAADRREAWTEVAERSGVTIVVDGPEALLVRAVDGGIEQILDNLISNALAVAPPDSTITVEVTPIATGGRLVVTDQGPGMSAEQRAHATARFWRPAGSTRPGSGLGLAIVDQLVLAGGGELSIEAAPEGPGLRVVADFRSVDHP